jgi:hypothetical protein
MIQNIVRFNHSSILIQEAAMKATDKGKRIRTAPKGAWESGIINEEWHRSKRQHLNEITTDSQGNGYPISHKSQES